MMTLVGTNRATAEQIRLAQMISDHTDADFEEKDECVIALHDCNGDVNRAINVLPEGNPDTHSWEVVGKKRGVSGQDGGQTESNEEGKENRDRDRDYSQRRGGPPRRGRGASRGQEFWGQENGLDGAKSGGPSGRGTDRGRRGRGRGRGSSGGEGEGFLLKGWEPLTQTVFNTGHFEPDDRTRLDFTGVEGSNYPRKFETAPGAWRTATEDWGTEDWNEDLSETKIFTASNVSSVPLPVENVTITAGQGTDLAVLLGKTPSSMENGSSNLDLSQAPSLAHNSKQNAISQAASGNTFSRHSAVSMLGKGFGDVGRAKGGSTTGSQFLEQFQTAQALAQLAAQHSQSGSTTTSSWDMGSTAQSPSLVQYDLKSANDSTVHSPFTKRQAFTPSSTMMEVFLQEKPPAVLKSTSAPQMSPGSSDNQSSSPQLAQQKLKRQKKKTSLTYKIPVLAVKMPGSSDISGLNLQFGSEPVFSDYESTPTTSPSSSQAPSSLCTRRKYPPPYKHFWMAES
uniref:Ubiquitin-associated protein 2-like n=1 Tax=Cricetulus griseus TaxID=10029 RepID=A0A8C2LW77_CRIGR